MAALRTAWKGSLKFGPIAFGIKLVGATSEAEKIKFKTLNRKTGHTVRSVYIDTETADQVPVEQQAKGFELSRSELVLIEKDEVEQLKPVAQHTIEISSFAPADSLDTRFLDKPYYVLPSDRAAASTYRLLFEALRDRDTVALSQVVLYQRSRQVVLSIVGDGIVMTTLRPAWQMVSAKSVFGNLKTPKVDTEIVEFASLLIDKKRIAFDPARFEDRYEASLADVIKAKQHGRKIAKAAPKPKEMVSDLAKLLRQSLKKEGVQVANSDRKAA